MPWSKSYQLPTLRSFLTYVAIHFHNKPLSATNHIVAVEFVQLLLSEVSMLLLRRLLLTARCLAPVFALPHRGLVEIGTVVANSSVVPNSSVLPTLPPQSMSWEQGRRPDLSEQPKGPSGRPIGDGRCFFFEVKMKAANGNAFWNPTDGDVTDNACNDYCAIQLAADKAQGKIGPASCFKNDGKPFVNDKGEEQSGS